jgi:hypothetical protein
MQMDLASGALQVSVMQGYREYIRIGASSLWIMSERLSGCVLASLCAHTLGYRFG